MTPEETRARLLYRDGLMLVLDKPAGVAVHRGPKGGSSLEDDFDALRFGLPRKPALAHRLDRETAGCLVLGRHHKALEKLGLLFKQGKIAKTYWAIVAGAPEGEEGAIDLTLGRLDDKRGWWMKVDPNGQTALTLWRVKGRGAWRGAPIAWLELEPQDRAHAPIARPLRRAGLADPRRRDLRRARRAFRCNCLARKVVVPLSKAKPPIEVEAPAPPHMLETLAACGFEGDRAAGVEDGAPILRGRWPARWDVGSTPVDRQASERGYGRDCAAQQIVKGSFDPSQVRAASPCRSEPPSIT